MTISQKSYSNLPFYYTYTSCLKHLGKGDENRTTCSVAGWINSKVCACKQRRSTGLDSLP